MNAAPSRAFLRALPAIELHIHLEGSLPRSAMASLARRHGLAAPRIGGFDGFGGFLKAFASACDLLVDEDDFHVAASALLSRLRRQGVVHAEVMFSPQVFLRRGIGLPGIMRGLMRAREEAMRKPGFSALYVLDGVRQWGGAWMEEVVRSTAPWAGRGLAAVGIGGDEASLPAREFARAFRLARDLGMRTTVHAGEADGASSLRECLTALQPDRIGHGVRAVEDPELLTELARRRVTLDVCPSSNVATRVVPALSSHPLPRLLAAGVAVTINSDDATLFGTDVRREMEIAAREFSLSEDQIVALTRNAARASFLPARTRAALIRRIDQAAAQVSRR